MRQIRDEKKLRDKQRRYILPDIKIPLLTPVGIDLSDEEQAPWELCQVENEEKRLTDLEIVENGTEKRENGDDNELKHANSHSSLPLVEETSIVTRKWSSHSLDGRRRSHTGVLTQSYFGTSSDSSTTYSKCSKKKTKKGIVVYFIFIV